MYRLCSETIKHMPWRRLAGSFLVLLFSLVGAGVVVEGTRNAEQVKPEVETKSVRVRDWESQMLRRASLVPVNKRERPRDPFASIPDTPMRMSPRSRQEAKTTLGGTHRLGLRFDQAQHVSTSLNFGIWVVRGKIVTCIFHDRTMAASCNANADVGREGLGLILLSPGSLRPNQPVHYLAFGVVEDDVKSVKLNVAGRTTIVPVTKNAYAFRAGHPVEVEALIRQ